MLHNKKMQKIIASFLPPLVFQLAKRDIAGRYRGSLLGLAWSFVNPLLMLAVYTFVFGMVFRGQGSDRTGFALSLFAGLIIFNLFSECITRSPMLIVTNPSYVKKVVFPLELLPWVSLGSALFHAAASLLVLLLFLLISGRGIHATVLLTPLIIMPLIPVILGASWILSSIGVYIRDIGNLVGMGMTVLMFLSPIFYPASALPEKVRPWLFLNPLGLIIEQTRNVLLSGVLPDWKSLVIYLAVALPFAWVGRVWFNKTRKGFADVL